MNCRWQVFKEDITKHACGAMVNAANSQLWHSGGIADHICRAAGPDFQATCNAHRAALPQVLVGTCVVTDAGYLPCTKVIHAVGPNFAGQMLCPFCTRAMYVWNLVHKRSADVCTGSASSQTLSRCCFVRL